MLMWNIDSYPLYYNYYNYLCRFLSKLNIMNYMLNIYIQMHNILKGSLKYMWRMLMCNIYMFLLYYNYNNYLYRVLSKLNIMNYMLNMYIQMHNIPKSSCKYMWIMLMLNIDRCYLINKINNEYYYLNK